MDPLEKPSIMRKPTAPPAKDTPTGHGPPGGWSGIEGGAEKKAVLLDAAGTLIDVARPVGETYAEIASQFGSKADEAAVSRAFRRAWSTMPPLAFPDREASDLEAAEYDWWRELVERTFGQVGGVADLDACFERLFDHYADPGAWRVFPEVEETLRMLRKRDIALAVVSNFDSRLPPLLEALGLAPFFQAIVHSSTAGAAKPARKIFDLALALVGVEAAQALHVGDSPTADLQGAHAAGIDALLIRRDNLALHQQALHRQPRHRQTPHRHEIISNLLMISGVLDARSPKGSG
ncbi:HAD-IA family hydrolase [Thioalkalivibrio sp. HK1]|uniref:HAD-IA family hydrolase n=1 Tax=Thioalkalivibrio sp. HK1 TaxID=1469245 RepID=UPI00046EF84E|nr:HAD-IA family hydrolase [Thioalkalivibrio sp. HK1]